MRGVVEIHRNGTTRLTVRDLVSGVDELREALDSLSADLSDHLYVEAVITENGVTRTVTVDAIHIPIHQRAEE